MSHEPLILLVDRFAPHVNRAEVTIGFWAGSHGRLFANLRKGKGCNVRTERMVIQWFSDNWPLDLEWPGAVPRPAKTARKDRAA
jgi:hypothetical protein